MNKILVPTDFSDSTMKAALYAAEIARKSGAVVHFVHAAGLGFEFIHQSFPLHEKYNHLVMENRMALLQQFVSIITDTYKDIHTNLALLDGTAVEEIIDYCHRHDIDLIVMGTEWADILNNVVIGSVTADVIARTNIPVLAIPGEYVVEEPDALVFATNHFEHDNVLLDKVIEMARIFSAIVYVVVFEEANTTDTKTTEQFTLQLQQYLVFLKETFPDVSFKGELLEGTSFEGAIERFCIKNEVDIIAMTTYPKDFWEKLFQKSVTRKMAVHSRIPVFAIPMNK